MTLLVFMIVATVFLPRISVLLHYQCLNFLHQAIGILVARLRR